jgi:hypothetical protein
VCSVKGVELFSTAGTLSACQEVFRSVVFHRLSADVACVLHAWPYECPVCSVWEKVKLVLTVASVLARNGNETVVAPVAGCGGVCIWQGSGCSRHEDVFAFNVLRKNIL